MRGGILKIEANIFERRKIPELLFCLFNIAHSGQDAVFCFQAVQPADGFDSGIPGGSGDQYFFQ